VIAECFVRLNHGLGVYLSVHPFVTPWHSIKMATPRITKSSLWAALKRLLFCHYWLVQYENGCR